MTAPCPANPSGEGSGIKGEGVEKGKKKKKKNYKYARTNIFKFSFVPLTIRDWNNLPHNVVEIADDAKFLKLLLFTILLESADPRCK